MSGKIKLLSTSVFILSALFNMSNNNEKFNASKIYFLWPKTISKEVFFEKDLKLEKDKTDGIALAKVTKTTNGCEYSIVEIISTSNNYPLLGQIFKRDFRSQWGECEWVLVSFKAKKIYQTSFLYYKFNPKIDEPISYEEIRTFLRGEK